MFPSLCGGQINTYETLGTWQKTENNSIAQKLFSCWIFKQTSSSSRKSCKCLERKKNEKIFTLNTFQRFCMCPRPKRNNWTLGRQFWVLLHHHHIMCVCGRRGEKLWPCKFFTHKLKIQTEGKIHFPLSSCIVFVAMDGKFVSGIFPQFSGFFA